MKDNFGSQMIFRKNENTLDEMNKIFRETNAGTLVMNDLTQVWLSLFPFFFVTKRSCLLSKLGKHLRSSTTCLYIDIHFVSTPQNVDFAH